MPDQNLNLNWESKGADKAKDDAARVAESQERLKEATRATVPPVEELTEAQTKLTASGEDWNALAGRLDPRLAALGDIMLKGTKIANDLATAQISMRDAVAKAATGIRNAAGAIKLFLAGGAVVAGILLIVNAFKQMGEQARLATEAIQKNSEAIAAQQQELRDLAVQIQAVADARRNIFLRTDEELKQDAQLARRVAQRAGVDRGVAAGVVGELAGAGLSFEEQVQATQLRAAGRLDPFDRSITARGRAGIVRARIRGSGAEFLEQAAQRQRERRETEQRQLSGRIRAGQATEAEIARGIEETGFAAGDRAQELAKLIKGLQEGAAEGAGLVGTGRFLARVAAPGGPAADVVARQEVLRRQGFEDVTAADIQDIRFIGRRLIEQGRPGGPQIIMNGSRNVFPDSQSRERQTTNGERAVRGVEPVTPF